MISRRDFVTNVAATTAGRHHRAAARARARLHRAERPAQHRRRRRRRHGPDQPAQPRARQQHRRALRRRLGLRRQGVDGRARGRPEARRGSPAEDRPDRRTRARTASIASRRSSSIAGRGPAAAEALHRLPRDARPAEGHRRGRRGHARSHARADRDGGDRSRQARLRAEAAHLVGGRGAQAGAQGAADTEGRHADGQPGPLVGRRAQGRGVGAVRRDRRRAPKCTSGPTVRSPTGRRAFRGRSRSASRRSCAGT